MAIKIIAVDMDGTFLNSQQDYDRERFAKIYQGMKEQGIRFVVASGNQYYQLKSFFPEIAKELSFVAENGAYVISEEQEIFYGEIDKQTVNDVLTILEQFDNGHIILCGKNSAYVSEKESTEFIRYGSKYYHRLKKVPSLFDIGEDVILKFALSFPVEQVEIVLAQLHEVLGDKLTPVSSGHGYIDLIISGLHKANGLMQLQALWGVAAEEIAAFGDSGNDVEMLAHVGHSFAMANGQPKVKETAKTIISSNDQQGVLTTIEHLLQNN